MRDTVISPFPPNFSTYLAVCFNNSGTRCGAGPKRCNHRILSHSSKHCCVTIMIDRLSIITMVVVSAAFPRLSRNRRRLLLCLAIQIKAESLALRAEEHGYGTHLERRGNHKLLSVAFRFNEQSQSSQVIFFASPLLLVRFECPIIN